MDKMFLNMEICPLPPAVAVCPKRKGQGFLSIPGLQYSSPVLRTQKSMVMMCSMFFNDGTAISGLEPSSYPTDGSKRHRVGGWVGFFKVMKTMHGSSACNTKLPAAV